VVQLEVKPAAHARSARHGEAKAAAVGAEGDGWGNEQLAAYHTQHEVAVEGCTASGQRLHQQQ
jgi:hypothetical protein